MINLTKNNMDQCGFLVTKLTKFLNKLPENRRLSFIQETIYILFRHQTLVDFDSEYIESVKDLISGDHTGCFNMIMGLTKELIEDPESALNCYVDAFEIFQKNNDELFML